MIRLRHSLLALLVVLLGSIPLLFAAVHATYTPDLFIFLQRSPAPFNNQAIVGTRLGQFKIWSDDGNVYSPVITVSTDAAGNIMMCGSYSWDPSDLSNNPYKPMDLTFLLYFLTYRQGDSPSSGRISTIIDNRAGLYGNTFNATGTAANPIVCDVYLLNGWFQDGNTINSNFSSSNPGAGFELDTPYIFKSPFNPHLGLATANAPNTDVYNYMSGVNVKPGSGSNTGAFVEVESPIATETGHETFVIGSGGFPAGGGKEIIYGDEPPAQPVINTFFSLSEQTVPIVLSQYTGTSVRKINTAILEVAVTNGTGSERINVDVTFTDNSPAGLGGFNLLHQTPGPSIPYNLYWSSTGANALITKGTPIQWNNLAKGTHTRDIYMGRINATTVNNAADGQYTSTITVTVTNRD